MKRKKSVKFQPSRQYIEKAVNDYLTSGGTITHLEYDENMYQNFMRTAATPTEVDEFLGA